VQWCCAFSYGLEQRTRPLGLCNPVVGFLLLANGDTYSRLQRQTRALERAIAVGERQMETIEKQSGVLERQTEALDQCSAALERVGRPRKKVSR
jgi:hypothetical protein